MSESSLNEYLWIAVVGAIVGFLYACGIGANDVANSFASTVASKSLTLKQAVIVAGIFEFCGAMFLGASVTSTIRSKIFDITLYDDEPEIIMLGMFTSLITGTIMLFTATYLSLPVSTTHTIVGCIMGFSIVAKGFDSIDWDVGRKIFVSWIVSPVVSAFVAFVFFGTIRLLVMKTDDAFNRANMTFPFVLTAGIGIDLFYILYKGMNNLDFAKNLELSWVLPFSFGFGALCGVIWIAILGPIIKKRIVEKREAREALEQKAKDLEAKPEDSAPEGSPEGQEMNDDKENNPTKTAEMEVDVAKKANVEVEEKEMESPKSIFQKFADNTFGQDLHAQSMHENAKAAELWDGAEVYDEDAEQLFTYVQVFTACLNSFAHGANDVSNAIAPISAIYHLYQEGVLESKSPVQKWILAMGGAGIVVGLLLYGYKIMKSLGYKVTPLSPSRGACAELASSLFVVTASFLEIPVSSTQCITGAVMGVGLVSGVRNIQWLFMLRICSGWVIIFFVSVLLSAGIFSMFAYSPSLTE